MRHSRRWLLLLLFALAGAGYVDVFSQLEISPLIKGSVAVIPLQILALVYVFWMNYQRSSIAALKREWDNE